MALIKYDPAEGRTLWRPFALDKNIQQMFDRFLDLPKDWEFPLKGGEQFPTVDISETPQEYTLRAEIPGMQKEDTRISVNNNVLTISGEKRSEAKHEDKKYHRVESYYGSFQRSFVLPDSIKADKVAAAYKDGILTVTVPKSEAAKERTVEIKVT
ncbi:MAG TPA: Hsp20/alpha crystallin family protein [bacterium]|nr:Hsp20/alpha crystallin family protein [bacterium]